MSEPIPIGGRPRPDQLGDDLAEDVGGKSFEELLFTRSSVEAGFSPKSVTSPKGPGATSSGSTTTTPRSPQRVSGFDAPPEPVVTTSTGSAKPPLGPKSPPRKGSESGKAAAAAGGKPTRKQGGPPEGFVPKPKLTRAERRALQEQQRAAKAEERARKASSQPSSGGGAGDDGKASGAKKGRAPLQYDDKNSMKKAAKKQVVHKKKSEKMVELFSHLPQYEAHSDYTKKICFSSKSQVHPRVLTLGLQMASGKIDGAQARCVAMLEAFKALIQNTSTPKDKEIRRHLDLELKPNIQFIIDCRPLCTSMGSAIKHLKTEIANLAPDMSEDEAKHDIIDSIDTYIQERILFAGAVISSTAADKISNGDVILTYSYDAVIESVIRKALEQNKEFTVIIVDTRPRFGGRGLLQKLDKLGVTCVYILMPAISHVMPRVGKVFVGCDALVANGSIKARAGTALVAMTAQAARVPVLVCCETFKFSERAQLDAITSNELSSPDLVLKDTAIPGAPHPLAEWRDIPELRLLNLEYDLTPIEYVTAVITEVGMVPPTSVPVILREYRKELQSGM
eukprot:TRINITY_DN4186_c0_g1_i10.p1 TRINITY_DN4186_c0_g1~~TRINITY_DN4186_c0_g1_i10.p1  ORF type:complete len:565 (+),score=129.35 TRINITY_DN4186_c0_g1_i10:1045-2739(+)